MKAAPAPRTSAGKKSITARLGIGRIALVALIAVLVTAFLGAGGLHYLSLDYLKRPGRDSLKIRHISA